jgi:hypothetical protein
MKCSVCCDAGVSNAFTKGSGNMRVSNIEHHMELDEHKTSVRTQTARKEVLLRATQLWLDAPISLRRPRARCASLGHLDRRIPELSVILMNFR